MSIVTLLLGSNLGDRHSFLAAARAEIAGKVGREVRATSVLCSEPWGYLSDNYYANQIIEVECFLAPLELLDRLQAIECSLGRVRGVEVSARYVDRTIDIDILYIDGSCGVVVCDSRLTVPHPLIGEREFV
ncbi:MAG: 2-amino-4-hydroxy-6-hydroxymethyldihydropteridine diphosphokinase, partial [Mucinivorans sp.]